MLTSVGGAGLIGPGSAPLTRVWMRKGAKKRSGSEGLGLGQGPEQVGASSRQPAQQTGG